MKLSIRWTIIIGCIFLVWCTHVIITPSSYLMTKRVLTKHMQDIMVNISDLTVEQAHNHLNKARSAAFLAKQLLSSNVVSDDIKGSSALERYLFDQLSIYPHLSGIYVGGLNGNFFMVSRHKKYEPDGFRTKVIRNEEDGFRSVDLTWRSTSYHQVASEQDPSDTYDPRTRPWFKKVEEHNHIIWTDPYIFFTAQKPGVTIAGPAYNEIGDLKGIVGVDIEIAELSTFISKLRVGKSGKAFILHRNGDMIAYHEMEKLIINKEGGLRKLPKINELEDRVTRLSFESIDWQYDEGGQLILDEPIFTQFESAGKAYLSMFTPFPEPELPWVIGVYIPEDDYLGEIKSNQLFSVLVTLIITLIASVIGLILARKIIKPVVKLSEAAKGIEQFDITTPFHLETVFKEIQETADSFTSMKVALSEYQKKLRDNEQIYRAITSTANDAIILINSGHEVTYMNRAAVEMFGYNKEEVYGQKLYKVLAPERDKELYRQGIVMFMQDESGIFEQRTVKATALAKDGHEVPIELSLSKLTLDETLYAVAIIRNITERKKAADLRKRLVNDLHDGIGGTLSNIKLLAEMTKSHKVVTDRTIKNLNAIAENSEDCITEIQNYINVLDNPELTWKDFMAELHRYSAKTLEIHDIHFSMNVAINSAAPSPTTLLYMNIFKVIKEALNNVIKHSNGNVVTFEGRVADNQAQLVFKDNGSVTDSPTDSGIGLMSMRSRVKELGGTILFSEDDGFCITMEFPFSRVTVRQQIIPDKEMTSKENQKERREE